MIQLITTHSGIGGPELAAEHLGWDIIASSEIDPDCRKVLQYYWPDSYHNEDIHTFTRGSIEQHSRWDSRGVTVLCSGFPCQPLSVAGLRKGETDDRYHWPEVHRLVEELRPDWLVVENVAGLKSMVFTPQKIRVESHAHLEGSTVYRTMGGDGILLRICDDLESSGYSVQPFAVPIIAVGADHIRERVFVFAHRNDRFHQHEGESLRSGRDTVESGDNQDAPGRPGSGGGGRAANGHGKLLEAGKPGRKGERDKQTHPPELSHVPGLWRGMRDEPPILSGHDGLPTDLVGITVPAHRIFSGRSYGNAISPAHILPFFKAIQEIESNLQSNSP